jgi:Ca-activated chloride channel homolog
MLGGNFQPNVPGHPGYTLQRLGCVPGRHRKPHASLSIAAGAVTVVLLGSFAGWAGYRLLNSPACTSRVSLVVAAAPEVAPAVRGAAATFSATHTGGVCATVEVDAREPADVAATIAGQRGTVLTGLGQANGQAGGQASGQASGQAGGKAPPQVWIPDSSTWLQRIRAVGTDLVPATAPSVAQSPVVLAMPQPVAATLGWPKAKLTWAALLQRMTTGAGIKVGIVEPGRDASGLSGLLALRAAAAATGGTAGQEATVAALRALATGRASVRDDLLGRFPRSADLTTIAASLAAAPLPEHAVISYNATHPAVPLAALFVDPAPSALDYPFAVLPGVRPDVATAARGLQQALSGTGYAAALAQHGLRNADGGTGGGFVALPGAPAKAVATAANADPALIQQMLSTWSAVTQSGRLLAVMDVSGSMKTPVPTAGNATREQVLVRAAAGGLALLDDTWSVGSWIFSTKLEGNQPWHQLVPIGPMSKQRAQLNAVLSQVVPTNGDTGLYDTVLAAYRAVQNGWDAGKVNSVLLFTDGINDNPGGLTLDQLVGELQKVVDPKRPVEVIAVGIGTDVSRPELTRITQATGGAVFIATDPAKIGEIFLQAIALRPGLTG